MVDLTPSFRDPLLPPSFREVGAEAHRRAVRPCYFPGEGAAGRGSLDGGTIPFIRM